VAFGSSGSRASRRLAAVQGVEHLLENSKGLGRRRSSSARLGEECEPALDADLERRCGGAFGLKPHIRRLHAPGQDLVHNRHQVGGPEPGMEGRVARILEHAREDLFRDRDQG
jgi:hypothetical protein